MDGGRFLMSVLCCALFSRLTRAETNLALNKPTSVSSSYTNIDNGSTANDGNSDGTFRSGSCFASQNRDSEPWWQVDLQASYIVKKIEIANREDCCSDRLHSVALELFDEDPSVELSTPAKLCYFITDIVTWATLTVRCTRPVSGRYLRLTKTSQRVYYDLLQFCEVKVYGGLADINSLCTREETNLALNKPTSVSSLYTNIDNGSIANDGNSDGIFRSGSCFASQSSDSEPWWQVDLQATYIVKKIEIANREDCCSDRLHSVAFELFDEDPSVEPSTPAKLCYFISDTVTWSALTIKCTRPVSGRYLRLTKTSQRNLVDLLQFCEVKVYGGLTDDNIPCASFVQIQGSRYDGASNITQGPEIDSAIACAVACKRVMTCIGFNIRYSPELTCKLVQNSDLILVQDAAWDFHCYRSCKSPSVIG